MSRFWNWALEAYGRPGVADCCLQLQDEHGQNVPLILWAVWAARQQLSPDLERGGALARSWDRAAVGPLRAARRSLKASLPDLADAAREALRHEVKAVELRAERVLMEALEALAAGGTAPSTTEAELLAEASRRYGAPAPAEVFAALLVRL